MDVRAGYESGPRTVKGPITARADDNGFTTQTAILAIKAAKTAKAANVFWISPPIQRVGN